MLENTTFFQRNLYTPCWRHNSLQMLVSTDCCWFKYGGGIHGKCNTSKMILYTYTASSGTLAYRKKQPPSSTRTRWLHRHRKCPESTPCTCHINIKYFLICKWVEWNVMILDHIHSSINMANQLTKALLILGLIPPTYSPVYMSKIGEFLNHTPNIDIFVPTSLTTPLIAVAAQVYIPIKADYQHSPWLAAIAHG